MKLISLGSSSKGNCHILYSNEVGIMLDCGINFRKLNHYIVDYNVKYILLSHIHGDHINGLLKETVIDMGFKIIGNDETIEKLQGTKYLNKFVVDKDCKYELDNLFDIATLEVPHDEKNYGYIIHDKKANIRTLYITDIGFIDNIKVNNIDNFIIECNYDEDGQEETQEENYYKVKRTTGIYGHLSLQGCIGFLNRSMSANTNNVILVHISNQNDNYQALCEKLKKELQFKNVKVKAINNHIVLGDCEITNLDTIYDNFTFNDIEFL